VRYSLDAKALSALFTQAVHPRQLIIRGPDDILERFPPGIPMNK
jgi:hypothetical protein